MKPPRFQYSSAESVEDALACLSEDPESTKLLAGGQSLMPLLNFRLATPLHIVDLNEVAELDYCQIGSDGQLEIGAMTRVSRLASSALILGGWSLICQAAGLVGHFQIRNRGTIGGSVAHADPAAELPTALVAMNATICIASVRGSRSVPADKFFDTYFTTALREDELITHVTVPRPADGTRQVFLEFSRRPGDFALASCACLMPSAEASPQDAPSLVVGCFGGRPRHLPAAEAAMTDGVRKGETLVKVAVVDLAQLSAAQDPNAPPEYRRHLAGVLIGRAVDQLDTLESVK